MSVAIPERSLADVVQTYWDRQQWLPIAVSHSVILDLLDSADTTAGADTGGDVTIDARGRARMQGALSLASWLELVRFVVGGPQGAPFLPPSGRPLLAQLDELGRGERAAAPERLRGLLAQYLGAPAPHDEVALCAREGLAAGVDEELPTLPPTPVVGLDQGEEAQTTIGAAPGHDRSFGAILDDMFLPPVEAQSSARAAAEAAVVRESEIPPEVAEAARSELMRRSSVPPTSAAEPLVEPSELPHLREDPPGLDVEALVRVPEDRPLAPAEQPSIVAAPPPVWDTDPPAAPPLRERTPLPDVRPAEPAPARADQSDSAHRQVVRRHQIPRSDPPVVLSRAPAARRSAQPATDGNDSLLGPGEERSWLMWAIVLAGLAASMYYLFFV